MPIASPVQQQPSTGWEALDTESGAYYNVSILDIKLGQILCQFEPAWKMAWVAGGHVRRSPSLPDSNATYKTGEQVEVKAQAQEPQPCGWWKGVIKSIKTGFALVHYIGMPDSQDDIVELVNIRPESKEKSIDLTHVKRVDLTLPSILKKTSSVPQTDPDVSHAPMFPAIMTRSGVMSISYCVADHKVVVVGTDSSLTVVRPMIDMAVAQQAQLQHIHNRTEQAKLQLRLAKEKALHSFVEEFTVAESLFGLVIGQNGSRINSVQSMAGIISANIDTQTGVVRIVGDSSQAVQSARAALEFVEFDVPIDPGMANWIRGKSNKTIQQLETMSKAHHMRIIDNDKSSCAVHIAGTKEAVQSARLLVEQHIEYREQWDKADQEQRQIMQQLYEMRRGQPSPLSRAPSTTPEGEPQLSTSTDNNKRRPHRKVKSGGRKKEGQKSPLRAKMTTDPAPAPGSSEPIGAGQ